MVLDGVVPESAGTVQGKSAAEGGSAIGVAAGVAAKQSDVLADPPRGRKKTPAEVIVPISDVPGAVVVGKKSRVPPGPKARTTPAAEGVVLGGVPGTVAGAESDANPKQPAVDGIVVCVGVTSAVFGDKTPDLMGLDEVPGDVTGMVVGGKLVNIGSPTGTPDTLVDPIGAGFNPHVGGSLVLEKVYVREKATAVANLPSLGGTPATPASMVHVGGDQDDNSSESPQLKDPPEQMQALDDWWKKSVPPHRKACPMGVAVSGPTRVELMKDLRRFQRERFQSEQARLGASPRKSVELMEASEEVEEDSGGG